MNYYATDSQHIYIGVVQIDPYGPLPPGTITPPPDTTGDEAAMWTGVDWVVLPERPPAPEPQPEPVPTSCTRRQGRLALLAHDHLDAVEAAIAAIADPTERLAAQIEYEADTWERANPFLQAMWASRGGTPEQLDDLFRMAVTL